MSIHVTGYWTLCYIISYICLFQYKWSDDTPYMYRNNMSLSAAEMVFLNTSQYIDYNLIIQANRYFMEDFSKKLAYVRLVSVANYSSYTELCSAIFLSYFTSPVWISMPCNDFLSRSYFLCEKKHGESFVNHPYLPSNFTCYRGYTYVDSSCWTVGTEVRRAITHAARVSVLFRMLTAWSLGHNSRNQMVLQTNGTHIYCLHTNDFNYQIYKYWRIVFGCKSRYVLVKKIPFTSIAQCKGTINTRIKKIANIVSSIM